MYRNMITGYGNKIYHPTQHKNTCSCIVVPSQKSDISGTSRFSCKAINLLFSLAQWASAWLEDVVSQLNKKKTHTPRFTQGKQNSKATYELV